jgi:hypothetical protein
MVLGRWSMVLAPMSKARSGRGHAGALVAAVGLFWLGGWLGTAWRSIGKSLAVQHHLFSYLQCSTTLSHFGVRLRISARSRLEEMLAITKS